MNRISLVLLFLLTAFFLKAQDDISAGPQMADTFRENGKIYVVITVIAIIFAAIIIFLAILERKIRKVESQLKNTEKSKH